MAACSKASSGHKPAMDDNHAAAASVKAAKGGSRGAFLAHLFLVLSVATLLCAVVYAPRFFFVSGPGAAAIAAISAPSSTTSRTRTPPSSAPFRLEEHVAAGRRETADRLADGGGAPPPPPHQHQQQVVVLDNQVGSPCASMPDNTICCDRSDYHSDVCFMSGDVRTDAASLSLLLFPPRSAAAAAAEPAAAVEEERIRPYTRKWDAYITKTIHEVTLRRVPPPAAAAAAHRHRCDVRHEAPVHVVTAGGYSHNTFHAFNDGLLPLWLTSQHLRRRVVLAVLGLTPRWARTYGAILAGVSAAAHRHAGIVDLLRDNRTHCFPGAIVGTRYHDYLSVNSSRLRDNKTIVDFHDFLAGVFSSNNRTKSAGGSTTSNGKPRLGIVSRKGRRVIENEAAVAALAEAVGFEVEVMETSAGAPVAAVHAAVSSYDALVGVHGADLTAFLFLRPGRAALAQVAPLGIAALSRNLFGVPAARMGLRYEQYDVTATESSLSRRYPPGHVVVADPARARREQGTKEWELVEHVYLRGQNVSLDLGRFRETLVRIHSWIMERRQQSRHASSLDASSSPRI